MSEGQLGIIVLTEFKKLMYEVSVEKTANIPLSDLIESVVKGEEVVFTKNNLPVAKLVAMRLENAKPQFGSAKGLFKMAEDFDEPLEDFDEYRK
jgi:antitoxin (DNA-binding transcriptional repressor) of toxin-antitoxin stability system